MVPMCPDPSSWDDTDHPAMKFILEQFEKNDRNRRTEAPFT